MTGFEMTINGMMSKMEKPLGASHRLAPTNTNTTVPYSTWRPYPEYKDSGVEWLGEVPAHWEAVAIKRITGIPVTDGPHETPEILDEGIPFISAEAIKNDKIDFVKKRGFISAQDHARFSRKYSPQRGDIFLIKSGATTGNVAFVDTDEEFNIWSPLAAIRPDSKKALTSFVFFFMKSRNFFQSIELGWNYGTQQNIGMNVIENIPIALPTLLEQSAIATFLNRETAKIDALISKKERQIELLQEKRTALISRAVTKGLDPTVPMKDSGVDWLGEIPAHWDIKRLKRLASVKGRIGFRGYTVDDLVDKNEGALALGGKHINNNNQLELSDPEYISWEKYYESPEIMVFRGDILFSQRGTLGKSAIIDCDIGSATINPSLIILKDINVYNKYLYCFLISKFITSLVDLISASTAVPMISQQQIGNFHILVPSINEQETIVAYIDNNLKIIDSLMTTIRESIDKLKEYRTTLISAAVTGKIDVREALSL